MERIEDYKQKNLSIHEHFSKILYLFKIHVDANWLFFTVLPVYFSPFLSDIPVVNADIWECAKSDAELWLLSFFFMLALKPTKFSGP